MITLVLTVALAGVPLGKARTPAPPSSASTVSAADTRTDAEIQDQVQTYLMTIDTPITDANWKSLGDRAVPMLEQITADDAKLPSRRAKAVEGMVAINPVNLEQKLTTLVQNPKMVEMVRWSAMRGLGRVVEPSRLVQLLNPSLEDADFRTRAVAAETLAKHAPTLACQSIRTKVDGDAAHRGAFVRAMSRCEGGK
ncbi:MAG: hypothetical protein ACT4TC_20995 [Myxococcaceae bacterium]